MFGVRPMLMEEFLLVKKDATEMLYDYDKYKKDIQMRNTKTEKVRNHLRQVGQISSWDAFMKFRATRLSAIIYAYASRDG